MSSIRVNGTRLPLKRMDYRSLGFKTPQEYAAARDKMRARFIASMKEGTIRVTPEVRDQMKARILERLRKEKV
jgi:hypothetical protein